MNQNKSDNKPYQEKPSAGPAVRKHGKKALQEVPLCQHQENSARPGRFDTPNLGGWPPPLSWGLQVNDSTLQRDCYGVRSVACAKFGKNVLDVALDCFLGNRELIGNQLI